MVSLDYLMDSFLTDRTLLRLAESARRKLDPFVNFSSRDTIRSLLDLIWLSAGIGLRVRVTKWDSMICGTGPPLSSPKVCALTAFCTKFKSLLTDPRRLKFS